MLSVVLKLTVILQICAYLVFCDEEKTNNISVTTTTAEAPLDLSGEATDNFESSRIQLDPGESRTRSKTHSYSHREHVYNHHHLHHTPPAYQKKTYEDQAIEYVRDTRPQDDDLYKDSEEDNYHHPPPPTPQHHPYQDDYPDSYETPQEQHHKHHPRHQDPRYEEQRPEKKAKYSAPDHSGNAPSPYGHQDYSKEESYESKENDGYHHDGRQPYLQYAYEVANKKQQPNYDPLDVTDNEDKSGYGPGETKVYPPVSHHQTAYYPRPKPTRYYQRGQKEEEYRPERQKEGNYFQAIPKDAGYSGDGQKEPAYLQTPMKENSYSQQAGYSHRQHEHPSHSSEAGYFPRNHKSLHHQEVSYSPKHKEQPYYSSKPNYSQRNHAKDDIFQTLQKAKQADGGKVAIYIKHADHPSSGKNPFGTKERQGFLLLPVEPDKMERIKEIREKHLGGGYRNYYQEEKSHSYHHRPIQEKEVYVHHEYPAEPKVAVPHDYAQEYEIAKPRVKHVFPEPTYGFRPIIKHQTYDDSEYDVPKTPQMAEYPEGGEVSEEGHVPVIPKSVAPYREEKEMTSYPKAHLVYGGPRGVIPSFTGAVKYEPASLYEKPHGYASPYDTTVSHKAKTRGYRPSFYSTLPHHLEYPKVTDYPSVGGRPKKKYSGTNYLYSTHYRNVGSRLAAEYGRPKLETLGKRPKSVVILQQPQDEESVVFRPSYSTKDRTYGKTLGELGLPHYESVLSKPKNGRTAVGALYYDLAPYSVDHSHTHLKSGSKYYS